MLSQAVLAVHLAGDLPPTPALGRLAQRWGTIARVLGNPLQCEVTAHGLCCEVRLLHLLSTGAQERWMVDGT